MSVTWLHMWSLTAFWIYILVCTWWLCPCGALGIGWVLPVGRWQQWWNSSYKEWDCWGRNKSSDVRTSWTDQFLETEKCISCSFMVKGSFALTLSRKTTSAVPSTEGEGGKLYHSPWEDELKVGGCHVEPILIIKWNHGEMIIFRQEQNTNFCQIGFQFIYLLNVFASD